MQLNRQEQFAPLYLALCRCTSCGKLILQSQLWFFSRLEVFLKQLPRQKTGGPFAHTIGLLTLRIMLKQVYQLWCWELWFCWVSCSTLVGALKRFFPCAQTMCRCIMRVSTFNLVPSKHWDQGDYQWDTCTFPSCLGWGLWFKTTWFLRLNRFCLATVPWSRRCRARMR